MKVRALDINGDWQFGRCLNDYLTANNAITQNIGTRLNSYLGDCFFNLNAGIDWFNLLGSKDQTTLNLSISSVILNTTGVTGLLQLSSGLNHSTRVFTAAYKVQTVYSTAAGLFQYDQNAIG
jgi:hypothetical protein